MKFDLGIDGCLYVVFRSEDEAEANAHLFDYCCFACFNGYMNAICLQDQSEPKGPSDE